MENRPSSENELVIDIVSDDEEPFTETTQKNETAMTLTTPQISFNGSAANADVPTSLEASAVPTGAFQKEANSTLCSLLLAPIPEIVPQQGSALNDPNLSSILGNYSANELARVTTKAMIECISRFPAIWDSSEPSYQNHKYCNILWKNIAVLLNINVKKAKAKWYGLRSAYRKEYFKSKETGVPSRFIYFQDLSFLETETLREKERSDIEKSLVPPDRNSVPNGTNSTILGDDEKEDDDCVIVENLGDCTGGSTSVMASELPSFNSILKKGKPETSYPEDQITQSVNAAKEQAKPTIRPKNISELLEKRPPETNGPNITVIGDPSNSSAKLSVSPEVVFLSEEPHPIPKASNLIISNAFPSTSKGLVSNKPPNSNKLSGDGNRMVSSFKKAFKEKPSKNKKRKTNLLKSSKNIATDSTPLKVSEVPNRLSTLMEKTTITPKKPEETESGKRALDEAKHSSNSKKARLSNSQTPLGRGSNELGSLREMNKGFLISLLPDVEVMTNAEFRTFKKQATALVSEILDS